MQIVVTLTPVQVQRLKSILDKPDNELTIQDARNLKRLIQGSVKKIKV